MSISLILIGIISLIVIAGTAYLLVSKSQQLSQDKKSKILLIVGVVIFVSFIVTTFKHPTLIRNRNQSSGEYDLNSIFFPVECKYQKVDKYATSKIEVSQEVLKEIYSRNYLPISKRPSQEEHKQQISQNLMFLSKKDEGASSFLSELAQSSCKNDHPTLYFKPNKGIKSDKQFAHSAGFHSYQQLVNSVCQYSGVEIKRTKKGSQYILKSHRGKSPYVIIDNFEHLIDTLSIDEYYYQSDFDEDVLQSQDQTKKITTKQRLIIRIMNDLMLRCKANLVLNSENEESIKTIYTLWEENLKKGENDLFPFQFHEWQGLKRYDIYKTIIKIIPNSDYILSKILDSNKKQQYNFNDLSNIIKQVQRTISISNDEKSTLKRQDTSLRQINMKVNVARYFGLGKAYKDIRSAETKLICFLKSKVSIEEIRRLQELDLVSIRNGNVYIQ